jgi:hypothetical protein
LNKSEKIFPDTQSSTALTQKTPPSQKVNLISFHAWRRHSRKNLQAESFAQVKPPDISVFNQFGGRAAAQDFPFRHNVSAISDAERFADVMVGD